MPNADTWRLKMPTVGVGKLDRPQAPKLEPMAKYPALDLTGIKDWLSSSLARQYMGAGFRPSQIGGIAAQAYAPMLQMEAQYPFQKWGAGEEARRFGAGYGADIWRTEAGMEQDTWSKMLMAALQRQEMQLRERMAFPKLFGLENMGGGGY